MFLFFFHPANPMKTIFLFLLLLLTACGPAVSASPTPQAEAQATPVAGFVTIVSDASIKSVKILSQPQSGAEVLGQALPGQRGDLLGADASGEWLLVQFDEIIGWIPIQVAQITSDY